MRSSSSDRGKSRKRIIAKKKVRGNKVKLISDKVAINSARYTRFNLRNMY